MFPNCKSPIIHQRTNERTNNALIGINAWLIARRENRSPFVPDARMHIYHCKIPGEVSLRGRSNEAEARLYERRESRTRSEGRGERARIRSIITKPRTAARAERFVTCISSWREETQAARTKRRQRRPLGSSGQLPPCPLPPAPPRPPCPLSVGPRGTYALCVSDLAGISESTWQQV